MSCDEMIAVIAAHRDRKTIQCKLRNSDQWCSSAAVFNFNEFDYRVKPEPPKPREFCLHFQEGSERNVIGHLVDDDHPFHGSLIHAIELLASYKQ